MLELGYSLSVGKFEFSLDSRTLISDVNFYTNWSVDSDIMLGETKVKFLLASFLPDISVFISSIYSTIYPESRVCLLESIGGSEKFEFILRVEA